MNKPKSTSRKTVGLVHGVFDVVHAGHILHFEEAKSKVNKLVASVTSDKFVNKAPGKPVFNDKLRIKFLKSLKFFDDVILSNAETAIESIKKIKPNIYFKGKDYFYDRNMTENLKKEIKEVKKIGGDVYFTNTPVFSSSKILNEKFGFIDDKVKNFLKFINVQKIKNKILKLKKTKHKVINIGDPIIDVYRYVTTSGKANKSSVISTQFLEKEEFGGGSILISKILSEYFENAKDFFYLDKPSEKRLHSLLPKKKKLVLNGKNKIIQKIRYLEKYTMQKLFQNTINENFELDKKDIFKLRNKVETLIQKFDYIFFYDYGYIYKNIFRNKILKKYKNKLIINCQSNSYNFGFNLASKYDHALILCMDEVEFRLTFQNKKDTVTTMMIKHKNKFKNIKYLIVTCGRNGCFTLFKNKVYFSPSVFRDLKDTTGCGDVFLATFGMLEISGNFDVYEKMLISHIAAGVHGDQIGNNFVVGQERLKKVCDNIIK